MNSANLHDRVLQRIYDHFRSEASWPSARELEFEFADEGEIDQIAHEIGSDFIYCDNPSASAPECRLTLAGIARCKGGEADLMNYIKSIKIFAKAYRNPDDDVSSDQVTTELGLTGLEAKRLSALIYHDGHLVSGGTSRDDGWWKFRPSRRAFQMRNVRSIDELLEARYPPRNNPAPPPHQEAEPQPEAEDATRLLFPSPDLASITNAGLRTVLAADLAELEICIRNRAWKSVGMLAGSCCEAILIDLIGRNPDVVPEKKRDQWENQLGLRELTQYASEGHLISPEGRMIVSVVKQWRDLVHPWRAKDHRFPSPAIAQTMLAFLSLLAEDLRRLDPTGESDPKE
jgi:hypothetical protein